MSKWLDNAIFYEIYPQSFKDSNDDGMGDINGIISKLDYIKWLGCDAIWLNPCFKSPFGDAGYDVEDYCMVAERYGTNDDLYRLFDECHKRDMHIILDLVPGHTSIKHKWFRESMKAENNQFSDRYIWSNSIWEDTSPLSCIRGISERDGSAAVNFFSMQPALNYGYFKCETSWQQPMNSVGAMETRAAIKDVMRFWLDKGCDGFRVDMAGSLVKNDNESSDGNVMLWQDFRHFLDEEYPNAVLVSEWGEPDKSLRSGFHMDFLLHFGPSHYNDLFRCDEPYFSSRGKGDISGFLEKYIENYNKTDGKGLICIPSGNHDMDRLRKRLSSEEMKCVFAFLLTMAGAPFIYYGDEVGLQYVENLTSVEGGYGRTGSRSPMQWDSSDNCGFSCCKKDKLYIAEDESDDKPTVEKLLKDENSLLHEVKRLIEIRHAHSCLQNRSQINFITTSGYPLAYIRENDKEKMLIIINPSSQKQEVCFNKCGTTVYAYGEKVQYDGEKYIIDGQSYGFIKL